MFLCGIRTAHPIARAKQNQSVKSILKKSYLPNQRCLCCASSEGSWGSPATQNTVCFECTPLGFRGTSKISPKALIGKQLLVAFGAQQEIRDAQEPCDSNQVSVTSGTPQAFRFLNQSTDDRISRWTASSWESRRDYVLGQNQVYTQTELRLKSTRN